MMNTYFFWNGEGRCSSDIYTCRTILDALLCNVDAVKGCYKLINGERVPCLGEFIAYVKWASKNFKLAQRRGFLCATKISA